ncbi:MAG: hypothetical protein JW944_13315 [Deltaproteobacteria bacterium]|nr:hypothetical protein [Deltaproteobacteria bacterium]
MDLLKRNMGRRQFIAAGSLAIGAGMLARPSDLVFAANVPSQDAQGAKSDGTKYGRYITYAVNSEPTDRGIQMFPAVPDLPGFSTLISGRMPPPGPMPGHDAPEKHDNEIEYLIHLGNDPDDPLDLGADVDFFMGKGKWLERYAINKSTAVYLPNGMWHCPWKIKKIRTEMTWVNVRIGSGKTGGGGPPPDAQGGAPGGAQGGMPEVEGLSEAEKSKAKTSNYIFDKYLLSGVPKEMKDPKGGKWIAYTDCTKIAGGALTRIIRYNPKEAPYTIIDSQTHEYGTLFLFHSTDLKDCTDLGAEIELCMGPEKEKHTLNKSALVYVPANTVHGPIRVTNASKPFNFLEIVAGPELPGAVY